MANNKQQLFVDEHHNNHQKTNVLGIGGQGIVYRTSDSDIAIKLATIKDSEKPITNKVDIRNFQTKIQNLRLLPIPENINITKPMAMLKDSAGYVMHLLNEMQPFSHFWHNAKDIEKIGKNSLWKKDSRGRGNRAVFESFWEQIECSNIFPSTWIVCRSKHFQNIFSKKVKSPILQGTSRLKASIKSHHHLHGTVNFLCHKMQADPLEEFIVEADTGIPLPIGSISQAGLLVIADG